MASDFDRAVEDIGNIVALEHVNVCVPDFATATRFYVNALGLTRDPYIEHGPDLMWINVGHQQFHLPFGEPNVVRGYVDLIFPDLGALENRLARASDWLAQTQFEYSTGDRLIEVRGPWGNRFRCRSATAATCLGMAGVTVPVRPGAAAGIARFYRQIIGAPASVDHATCVVVAGPGQHLCFVETDEAIVDYDGHHIAVYVSDFSGPHRGLLGDDLIVEESDQHQYRFNWIVDPESGEKLFELEHEIRSMHHPLRGRPLVNRNPDQTTVRYRPGADAFVG